MLEDLIPLESSTEQHGPDKKRWQDRLIIGHNVGFDRSFVKEQYYLQVSGKYYTILSRDTVLYRPRPLNHFTTSVFYGKSPQKKEKKKCVLTNSLKKSMRSSHLCLDFN